MESRGFFRAITRGHFAPCSRPIAEKQRFSPRPLPPSGASANRGAYYAAALGPTPAARPPGCPRHGRHYAAPGAKPTPRARPGQWCPAHTAGVYAGVGRPQTPRPGPPKGGLRHTGPLCRRGHDHRPLSPFSPSGAPAHGRLLCPGVCLLTAAPLPKMVPPPTRGAFSPPCHTTGLPGSGAPPTRPAHYAAIGVNHRRRPAAEWCLATGWPIMPPVGGHLPAPRCRGCLPPPGPNPPLGVLRPPLPPPRPGVPPHGPFCRPRLTTAAPRRRNGPRHTLWSPPPGPPTLATTAPRPCFFLKGGGFAARGFIYTTALGFPPHRGFFSPLMDAAPHRLAPTEEYYKTKFIYFFLYRYLFFFPLPH